ncbi:hypothetical protein NQ314_009218 [Rhamnusium bicolor]|uniref:Uncharacterized protein n=1 Tax=Rhamnusium bicolor TaxID=1586634 RepID=A0AAV8Y301_9CUCU|nr:hypothetical protein NQ314_009218 [Rhamnusium bicolor]
MNRSGLLVQLAKNNETVCRLKNDSSNVLPGEGLPLPSKLEFGNKEEDDPYIFTETNDEFYSRIDTDNFPMHEIQSSFSTYNSMPDNDNYAKPVTETKNIGSNFSKNSDVTDIRIDNSLTQTYIPISNQENPNLQDESIEHHNSVQLPLATVYTDKKIHVLDYKIFPAETFSKLADNSNCALNMNPVNTEEFEYKTVEMEVASDEIYNSSLPKPSTSREIPFECSDDHCSDVDYILSSNETDSPSNADSQEFLCASVKNCTKSTEHEKLPDNEPLLTNLASGQDINSTIEIDHFARHLIKKHSDDEAIKKISEIPLKSKERRNTIMSLKKKGNFVLHQQKDKLKVVRLPNKCYNKQPEDGDYIPCVNCLGFYKKSYLWRHKKICKSKMGNETAHSKNHLTESQTFLATTGILRNVLNTGRIKKEVFSIMKPDNISYTAKTDPLICLFGESYINKHKRKQMNIVVSNKMRELARLKLAIRNSSTIQHLIDDLKPECYEHIVAATKLISGYNVEKRTYNASSLAMHMGATLKFLCDVTKAILTKNPLFQHIDREKKIREIKDLRHMINMHWCNDVSSLANKVLNEVKFSKPKLLPFTKDIKTLNLYVRTSAERAYNNLRDRIDSKNNYKILKCLNSLSELEKNMSSTFKRVVVFCKGSKPVPILFTKLMQRYIEMLLTIRNNTEVVPKSNTYIFANLDSQDRWASGPSVLRKYAHKCGAQNPELLTSTRFRKQLATILQLMNFKNDEMEQIARFMGHTEKTHKEFYRLTDDIYQTAKVAKVLLLLNVGKGSEFKGKSLEEIEVADDVLECQEETAEDEETGNIKEQNEEKEEEPQIQVSQVQVLQQVQKRSRVRWDNGEKEMVLKHFKKHIKSKTAPRKQDCLNFIDNHPDKFFVSDWVRIKTLVFNTYRGQ